MKEFQKLEGALLEHIRYSTVNPGYKEIKCHIIFDIKVDGKFIQKARFVSGVHSTDPPQLSNIQMWYQRTELGFNF